MCDNSDIRAKKAHIGFSSDREFLDIRTSFRPSMRYKILSASFDLFIL